MIKAGLNENELQALRKLGGEPVVQSADFQSSSLISSSSLAEASSSVPIPPAPQSGVTVKVKNTNILITKQTFNWPYLVSYF